MDGIRMDSHKLIYHVGRVNDWMNGKNIYPIFIDVSPTNACNHRCIFCGLDFAHKTKISFLRFDVLERMVKDASLHGLKSIMYAGEGEPLLNKDMPEIIKMTKSYGVDVSLATNGALLSREMSKKILKYLTWIRVSIDAGTAGTYSKIHTCKISDFEKVLNNLKNAVTVKKKGKLGVTIGTQFLLLKENADEAGILAKRLAGVGVDYLAIKPYSKHPLSMNDAGTELDYGKMIGMEKDLAKYNTKTFSVIFRGRTMEKKFKEKPYKRCLGIPFWAYISGTGEVFPCHTFLGVKKYSFGNINDRSFSSIWKSAKRRAVMEYFEHMDARRCRELCRLDEINSYLWQLKHPHPHVNFI